MKQNMKMLKGPKCPLLTVAQISRSLTRVQKEQVLRGSIGDAGMVTVRALIQKGLMHIKATSPNGRYGPCVLTALGRQVQAELSASR